MHSSLLQVLVTSHAASASVHKTRSSNAVYSTKFASECDVTLELYRMPIHAWKTFEGYIKSLFLFRFIELLNYSTVQLDFNFTKTRVCNGTHTARTSKDLQHLCENMRN